MRTAAILLVLVVGAAVVLLFGNTLNSWVLGGVIGGLVALLISIPISLQLFFFLSKRHEERLEAQEYEQEEIALARAGYVYPQISTEVYEEEAEDYLLESEVVEYEEMQVRRSPVVRNAPEPPLPRLPAARQSQAMEYSVYQQRSMPRQQQDWPVAREGGNSSRRPAADRRARNSSFLGYQANAIRSQHQTAALRAARREALAQQQGDQDDYDVLPTSYSRRLPVARPAQSLIEQPDRSVRKSGPSRQLPQQMGYPVRHQRVVDAEPSQYAPRSLPARGESSASRPPTTDPLRGHESQIDHLQDQLAQQQTGPFRQQQQTDAIRRQGQTGQIPRNRQVTDARRKIDADTEALNRPLVRRAPYTYEDDPIRQELAQHLEPPAVRRSSRTEDEFE